MLTSRKARCLTTFAILTISSGCCSVPPHVPFETPDRFIFEVYSDELWSVIPDEAKQKISDDIADAQGYIKETEARAEIHND